MQNAVRKLRLALEIASSPAIAIDCFGGPAAKRIWQKLTARHPRFPLVGAKTFGAALQKIGPTNQLFTGSRFEMFRRRARKGEKAGYRFSEIDPTHHFDEILAVNTSSSTRQGKSMPASYTDPKQVRRHAPDPGHWFGIFDKSGTLRAYAHAPVFGDAFVFSRILGDARFFDDGIMYLLVRETMLEMARRRDSDGHPNWAFYDMFLGANPGLAEFKRRSGFRPARAQWRWVEK